MSQSSRPLLLLSAFSKGLSHKLRTPLSVVSNEASYLKSLAGEEECQRSLVKCREIAAILKDASFVCNDSLEMGKVAVDQLLRDFHNSQDDQRGCVINIEDNQTGCLVRGNRKALLEGLQLVCKLAVILSSGNKGGSDEVLVSCALERKESQMGCMKISIPRLYQIDEAVFQAENNSLTELFCLTLDLDLYLPPMIDSIFWAHDWEIKTAFSGSKDFPLLDIFLRFRLEQ